MTKNTPAPADLVEAVARAINLVRFEDDGSSPCDDDQDMAQAAITAMQAYMASDAHREEIRQAIAKYQRDMGLNVEDAWQDACGIEEAINPIIAHRPAAAITLQPDPRDAEIERLTKEADDHAEAASQWRSEAGNLQAEVERLREALEPFALISTEGVVNVRSGHVRIVTCAEYFHEAAAALAKSEGK